MLIRVYQFVSPGLCHLICHFVYRDSDSAYICASISPSPVNQQMSALAANGNSATLFHSCLSSNPIPSSPLPIPSNSGPSLDSLSGPLSHVPDLQVPSNESADSEDFKFVTPKDIDCSTSPASCVNTVNSADDDLLSIQSNSASDSNETFEHVDHISLSNLVNCPAQSSDVPLDDQFPVAPPSLPAPFSCDLLGRTLLSCLPMPVQSRCDTPYDTPGSTASASPHKRPIQSSSPSMSTMSASSASPSKCSRVMMRDDDSSSPVVPEYIIFHGVRFYATHPHVSSPGPARSPS
ncbi:hypothetical protein GYMLUDRAFT_252301 [Collybiopsis luxurians FD-317 M1]|uniref:Unplaced genomic scaffold GYMLUscaffold_122, whole genome shotgun sequence n=1 Tax=Collybiopsis luxurians FD-317 M1 TaxID=944289 RepID=A0A0D0BA83_9AGAR|nr:hypothetical protein GYMLUDRAFT_252301 [Collybiopsis luxurians FD-317 M1]